MALDKSYLLGEVRICTAGAHCWRVLLRPNYVACQLPCGIDAILLQETKSRVHWLPNIYEKHLIQGTYSKPLTQFFKMKPSEKSRLRS